MIVPMRPKVLVNVGPVVSLLELLLSDLPFLVKGKTLALRDKLVSGWMMNGRNGASFDLFYETDYSAFDATVTKPLRHVENVLVDKVVDTYGLENDTLRLCLSFFRRSKIVFKHRNGVMYSGPMMRLSGEPATSIGNALINNFTTWLAFGCQFGANVPGGVDCYVSFHEGDDGIVGVKRGTNFDVSVAAQLGLNLTVETHHCLSDVKFCGRYLINESSVCRIFETLRRFHLSDTTCQNTLGVLKAKAMSYWATDSRTPVVSALAYIILRDLPTVRAVFQSSELRYKSETMKLEYVMPSVVPLFENCLIRDGDDVVTLRRMHHQVLGSYLDLSGDLPRLSCRVLDPGMSECDDYFIFLS